MYPEPSSGTEIGQVFEGLHKVETARCRALYHRHGWRLRQVKQRDGRYTMSIEGYSWFPNYDGWEECFTRVTRLAIGKSTYFPKTLPRQYEIDAFMRRLRRETKGRNYECRGASRIGCPTRIARTYDD